MQSPGNVIKARKRGEILSERREARRPREAAREIHSARCDTHLSVLGEGSCTSHRQVWGQAEWLGGMEVKSPAMADEGTYLQGS